MLGLDLTFVLMINIAQMVNLIKYLSTDIYHNGTSGAELILGKYSSNI